MSEFTKDGCLILNGVTCPHGANAWCRPCADALKPAGRLAAAVESLAATLEFVRGDIEAASAPVGVKPEQMRDSYGRYLLLDAQTALVNGWATIVNGGRSA